MTDKTKPIDRSTARNLRKQLEMLDMGLCSRCQRPFWLREMAAKGGKPRYECKACHAARMRESRRQATRQRCSKQDPVAPPLTAPRLPIMPEADQQAMERTLRQAKALFTD